MKNMLNEFKAFAMKGSVMDLAIGVIIGAAFGKIVSALVDSIITPLIGIILGGKNFQDLAFHVGQAQIKYGMFISAVIDFIIIAIILFVLVKAINKMSRKKAEEAPAPTKSAELIVLEQIRDSLKK